VLRSYLILIYENATSTPRRVLVFANIDIPSTSDQLASCCYAHNMISSGSKRKLKAFQFIEGAPSDNKENLSPNRAIKKQKISDLPSTPSNLASRIPLTHLIGQQDCRVSEVSTEQDHVHWKQATPKPSQITPGRKKKKRAHSSSPPSVNKSFKTPKHDPANEIWSRYNAGLNESALRASQSGLENLLIESSPRSSEHAGSVSGLRRYNSCGLQWPATKKKQKKHSSLPNTFDNNILEKTDVPKASVSKVALLLEEVQRINTVDKPDPIAEESQDQEHELQQESPLDSKKEKNDDSFLYDDEDLDINSEQLNELMETKQPPLLQSKPDVPVPHSQSVVPAVLSPPAPQQTNRNVDAFDDDFDDDEWDQLATTAFQPSAPEPLPQPQVNEPLKPPLHDDDDEYDDDVDFDDFEMEKAFTQSVR